ncbi:MAG: LysR family transcriptional regulator [Pseudomonadota bacterium]
MQQTFTGMQCRNGWDEALRYVAGEAPRCFTEKWVRPLRIDVTTGLVYAVLCRDGLGPRGSRSRRVSISPLCCYRRRYLRVRGEKKHTPDQERTFSIPQSTHAYKIELPCNGKLPLRSGQAVWKASLVMITATPWFIRARLRTRHLLLLTAVGEEGNIGRAAELLNMSQSAASRLLTDLEEIIGSQLFDRLPRGVRANWYGQTMIRHARIALASLSEAANEIDLLKSGRTGQVSIGTIPGPAISFVPRAVARVADEYPLVKVQLQVESSDELIEALQTGKIEVMVGRLLDRHEKSNFNYQRLADEPVCAVVRKDHPLRGRSDLDLQALASAAWIVPPVGTVLRHRFDLMFRDADYPSPAQVIEAVSPMVVIRLLEETNYLAVLAKDVAEYYAACGLISILDVPISCHLDSFGIITRKDWLLSPAACTICEALVEAVADSNRIRRPVLRSVGEVPA